MDTKFLEKIIIVFLKKKMKEMCKNKKKKNANNHFQHLTSTKTCLNLVFNSNP